MSAKRPLSIALAAGLSILPSVFAQTSVVTDPVGFISTSCLSNSDTFVSIPFTRPPEFTGTVQSVSASTVTVNGTPGWSNNQFVYSAGSQPKHYYVLFGTGGSSNPKEGHTFTVTSNTASTLTLDTSFEPLTGVTTNTQIILIPYWTPASIFPASDANVSFTPTTSVATYKTQLLIPAVSAASSYVYSATYFYSNNVDGSTSGWRLVGDNTTDHGDDPLLPDSYFVVRNNNSAPTLPLTSLGSVLMKTLTVPFITSPSQATDNPVAMVRPVDAPLNLTGLALADRSFAVNDQLLLFDNTTASLNKTPSVTYVYNDGWKLSTDPNTDHGNDLIPAGSALLVRKAASSLNPVSWTNYATYAGGFAIRPVQLTSRRAHGAAGTFDVNMFTVGSVGVEPRRGTGASGKDFQIVATLPLPVTSVSGTNVSSSDSAATADAPTFSTLNGRGIVTVNVHNVANIQTLSLTLLGVNDGTNSGDVAIPVGVLLGDTTGDKTVNSSDVSQTKSRSGQTVANTNFRSDVSGEGILNSADVSLVKSKSGTALP